MVPNKLANPSPNAITKTPAVTAEGDSDQNKQIKVTTAQEGLLLLSNQKLQGFVMSRSYGDYLLHNELHILILGYHYREQQHQ